MSEKKSDILEPNYDGALIHQKHVKAGTFIKKTKEQRNTEIKQLHRELSSETTTLCFVSAEGALYELISNPSTDSTTDTDWKKLDFGVSDILVAKGTWDADNTTPVLADTGAVGNGNDFYVVTGAATPTVVQIEGLFGGASITVTDGDWIISNGTQWFNSPSPINWDSISGIPQTILDYVGGTVVSHSQAQSTIVGLIDDLALKYDVAAVGDHGEAFSSLDDGKLMDVFLTKTNFYQKSETYSKSEVDGLTNNVLTTKGDLLGFSTAKDRLAIGANGKVLMADDLSTFGFKWETIIQKTATINISTAELKAINTTPKILVVAQGANTIIAVKSIAYKYNFGTLRFQEALLDSGTADGTTANRLIDSTQDFLTSLAGESTIVHNTTDDTYDTVIAPVSDTELLMNADIMISGEDYKIYQSPSSFDININGDTIENNISISNRSASFNAIAIPLSTLGNNDLINQSLILTSQADLTEGDGNLDIVIEYSVIAF